MQLTELPIIVEHGQPLEIALIKKTSNIGPIQVGRPGKHLFRILDRIS